MLFISPRASLGQDALFGLGQDSEKKAMEEALKSGKAAAGRDDNTRLVLAALGCLFLVGGLFIGGLVANSIFRASLKGRLVGGGKVI